VAGAPAKCPECGRQVAWARGRLKLGGKVVRVRWCPRCGHEERTPASANNGRPTEGDG